MNYMSQIFKNEKVIYFIISFLIMIFLKVNININMSFRLKASKKKALIFFKKFKLEKYLLLDKMFYKINVKYILILCLK